VEYITPLNIAKKLDHLKIDFFSARYYIVIYVRYVTRTAKIRHGGKRDIDS